MQSEPVFVFSWGAVTVPILYRIMEGIEAWRLKICPLEKSAMKYSNSAIDFYTSKG